MGIRVLLAAAVAALVWFFPASRCAAAGPADFTVRTVTVQVLRADATPVEHALVRAVSDDWGWRVPRDAWEWSTTDAEGRVTLPLTQGAWSFVAAGDYAFTNAHPGRALFLARTGVAIDADETVTLQVDRESACAFHAIGGGPLSVDELRVTLADRAPGWVSATSGWSPDGQLVLETSAATGTARLAVVHRTEPSSPAYLLQGTVPPGGTLELLPAPATVSTFRFQSTDAEQLPTEGNVEIRTPTFDSNNFVWDIDTPGARVLYTNAPRVRLNHRFIRENEYFYFVGDVRDLVAGMDTTIAFGGQLNSFLHVIPRNNAEFGEWTQVWLQVSDSHDHTLHWPPTSAPVHFRVFENGVLAAESDFDRYYMGFPRWFAEDGTTTCELTVPGGSFGTMGLADTLFAPWTTWPTSGAASTHFSVFAPQAVDPVLGPMLDFMEGYYDALRPLAWGDIGARVQYVVDVNGAGMPGEVVPLKVPLNVQQDCDVRDPATLFFPGHEMGHVRLLHPSCGRTLQVPFQEYGESYASLLCLAGYEGLVPASILQVEQGSHDLIYRHLAFGVPVADVWDRTETLQWVEAWIQRRFGWDVHRRMMFEYATELDPLRQALMDQGFAEWEVIPTLYSRLAGENLGWLWEMAELGVSAARVQEGLDRIQDVGAPGIATSAVPWLAAPAPNPAAEVTRLRFGLARATNVRLDVFDVAGRRVATLASGALPAGEQTRSWNLRRSDGAPCDPGLYFVRLRAGDRTLERRIVVTR